MRNYNREKSIANPKFFQAMVNLYGEERYELYTPFSSKQKKIAENERKKYMPPVLIYLK